MKGIFDHSKEVLHSNAKAILARNTPVRMTGNSCCVSCTPNLAFSNIYERWRYSFARKAKT